METSSQPEESEQEMFSELAERGVPTKVENVIEGVEGQPSIPPINWAQIPEQVHISTA